MEGHSKQDICQDIACIQFWDPGAEDSSFGTENTVQGRHYISYSRWSSVAKITEALIGVG